VLLSNYERQQGSKQAFPKVDDISLRIHLTFKFMWNQPTKEELEQIPPLGSQSEVEVRDIVIYLHFFMGACDWYIAEYDGNDIFWGYANLGDPMMAEWGTISFQELKDLKAHAPIYAEGKLIGNLPVEVDCDKFWNPVKVSVIKKII